MGGVSVLRSVATTPRTSHVADVDAARGNMSHRSVDYLVRNSAGPSRARSDACASFVGARAAQRAAAAPPTRRDGGARTGDAAAFVFASAARQHAAENRSRGLSLDLDAATTRCWPASRRRRPAWPRCARPEGAMGGTRA